jgi:NADPH:quinone reductase-like Zn-dependent oxidoreductase
MTIPSTPKTPIQERPALMNAWRQDHYGSADAVTLQQIPVPRPGPGEVLVRPRAVGLNRGDVRVMRGEPLLVRAFFGRRRPRQQVRGMDAAATVVAIGDGVTDVAVGDEVVGELPGGALAGFALAPASRLVVRPGGLDPVLAASLPIAGGTAWQALERAGIPDAQATSRRVLVIGASGGVGTFAVQLAALRGAEVWALCGERNRRLVEGLGAARTFDYHAVQPGDRELTEASFDAVIDIAGTAPLRALQRLVRDGGAVVLVAGEGSRVLGPVGRIARSAALSLGSGRPLRPLAAVPRPEILRRLVTLAAEGRLRPAIERVYPFGEAQAALAHVEAGHTVGKVVVTAD